MPNESKLSRLEQLCAIFARYGVEFLVVGGQAEYLFGSPRITFDVDVCYRRTTENLQRLAEALKELKPTLRGAPADLPFNIDARALALGSKFTFDTLHGPLDLLGYVEPLGDYDALLPQTETYDLSGLIIRTISLDDLIRVKEHIQRPRDRESLLQLKAIRQLREKS